MGGGYDYCVSHLVIWLSPKAVSSIDAVSTQHLVFFNSTQDRLSCVEHYQHFHFRLN